MPKHRIFITLGLRKNTGDIETLTLADYRIPIEPHKGLKITLGSDLIRMKCTSVEWVEESGLIDVEATSIEKFDPVDFRNKKEALIEYGFEE